MFGSPSVYPGLRGQATNQWTLQPSEAVLIPPGPWMVSCRLYSEVQVRDQVSGIWRPLGSTHAGFTYVNSDGNNFRVANTTGCAVGAIVTNAGSGYTSAPTVTADAGSSTWVAVVGGAVNGTVTVVNGGTNYTFPPQVVISAPNFGSGNGVQAAGYASLTSGAVSSITISQPGAGYTAIPTITLVNDPRDTTGTGASAQLTLTGAGTITAVLCTNHGKGALTAVPTLTFAGGGGSSGAATAIMDWTITAYAVTAGGAGYVTPVDITGSGGQVAGTAVNSAYDKNLVTIRRANIQAAISSTALTATGEIVIDGGRYSAAPTAMISSPTAPTTVATLTLTMGGVADTVLLFAS